jgi:hypothetical protein
MTNILNTRRLEKEVLAPGSFLSLTDEERANIKNMRIIPAEFGSGDGFGKIEIEYKHPVYRYLS